MVYTLKKLIRKGIIKRDPYVHDYLIYNVGSTPENIIVHSDQSYINLTI